MAEERVERRLTAILAADVAGYSRLMGADEEGTLAALKTLRREVADPKIKEHRGRIVNTTGDGLLSEFASVVDAVRCAVEVQREMAAAQRRRAKPNGASISASASISATSLSTRTTSSATVSTSRRALRPWLNRAASASAGWYAIRCATSSPSRSRTWASSRSRTSPGRCAPIALFSQRGPTGLRSCRRRRRHGRCPTGPRSPSFRLTMSVAIPSRNISSTALPRTSSLRCRNGAGFSSSPAIPHSPTKENPSTSRRSAATLASAMSSRVACAGPGSGCASAASSSIQPPVPISGPSVTTGI